MTRVWYKFEFLISLLGNLILVIINSQEFKLARSEILNIQACLIRSFKPLMGIPLTT